MVVPRVKTGTGISRGAFPQLRRRIPEFGIVLTRTTGLGHGLFVSSRLARSSDGRAVPVGAGLMGRNRFIGYSVVASAMRADRSVDGRCMMGTSASVKRRVMIRARASIGAHFVMRTCVSVGARCLVPALVGIGGSAYPTSMRSALMRAGRFALTTFLTMIRLLGSKIEEWQTADARNRD